MARGRTPISPCAVRAPPPRGYGSRRPDTGLLARVVARRVLDEVRRRAAATGRHGIDPRFRARTNSFRDVVLRRGDHALRASTAPARRPTAKYMAVMGRRHAVDRSAKTLTRSSGDCRRTPSSMSASVSMAMPTRPTSPCRRAGRRNRARAAVGRIEGGRSAASWPCAHQVTLKRAVGPRAGGCRKPMYWRNRPQAARGNMCVWIPPRVKRILARPGRRHASTVRRPARSSGPLDRLDRKTRQCVLEILPSRSLLRRAMAGVTRGSPWEGPSRSPAERGRAHRETRGRTPSASERVEIRRGGTIPARRTNTGRRPAPCARARPSSTRRASGTWAPGENREADHVTSSSTASATISSGRAAEPPCRRPRGRRRAAPCTTNLGAGGRAPFETGLPRSGLSRPVPP